MNLLDGKSISQEIKDELKLEVAQMKNGAPTLAVVKVGDDQASATYVKNKIIACEYIGIESIEVELPGDTAERELEDVVSQFNHDDNVDGILVQLPLPKHIDESKILGLIDDVKDVDGFSEGNCGKLFLGKDGVGACTPSGIVELIKRNNIEIEGKHCVVVGRSNIVGKPVAQMMLAENATVTIVHSKTNDIERHTKEADILIVAAGQKRMISDKHVKDGAVVIDVGIHRTSEGLCGDVDFESVKHKASHITPVPGGVGPMTIAMLMQNTVNAFKNK